MLYKRNEVWWVRFTAPSGERIRRSAGTRDKIAASEFHDRLKAEYWRVERLGEQKRRLWQEAIVKWLGETSHKKKRTIKTSNGFVIYMRFCRISIWMKLTMI